MIIKGVEYTDQEAYNKFIDDFVELIEIYKTYSASGDDQIPRHYGHKMCQSDRDPIRDADTIESDLYDEGWNEENLSELFSKFKNDLMNELNEKSIGGFDVFLYNWTNGDFPLGGSELAEDASENLIRYSYGWNKTKYGQLILKQNKMLDNFLETSASSFSEESLKIVISWLCKPGNVAKVGDNWVFDNYLENNKINQIILKCKKYVKLDKNVLTIQYPKIIDVVNLAMFINFDNNPEEMYQPSDFLTELRDFCTSQIVHPINLDKITTSLTEDEIVITF